LIASLFFLQKRIFLILLHRFWSIFTAIINIFSYIVNDRIFSSVMGDYQAEDFPFPFTDKPVIMPLD